jgi:hypothetical protein
MNRITLLLAAVCLFTGCATTTTTSTSAPPSPTGPAGLPRANKGESVLVVVNTVKADKRRQFEAFLHDSFWPMGRNVGQTDLLLSRTFAHTRILHPKAANQDGTFTYVFLMDPVLADATYDIEKLLLRGYPPDEAKRLYAQFKDSLQGEQLVYAFEQSQD